MLMFWGKRATLIRRTRQGAPRLVHGKESTDGGPQGSPAIGLRGGPIGLDLAGAGGEHDELIRQRADILRRPPNQSDHWGGAIMRRFNRLCGPIFRGFEVYADRNRPAKSYTTYLASDRGDLSFGDYCKQWPRTSLRYRPGTFDDDGIIAGTRSLIRALVLSHLHGVGTRDDCSVRNLHRP